MPDAPLTQNSVEKPARQFLPKAKAFTFISSFLRSAMLRQLSDIFHLYLPHLYFKMNPKYTLVIGLEVHAQLLTESKVFCGDKATFGNSANTNVSPVSLGHPGTLPKTNKRAVEMAIKLGLACNSEINRFHFFDRKNYFYPDLPKGYQITQDEAPVCIGGSVGLRLKSGLKKSVKLNRIHLEEDAGKLLHPTDYQYSQIDLNRAGVPLIEIVTEPEITTSEEAGAFLTEIRKLVRYLDVCDGNMEEGSLRCDANVSVMPFGYSVLGKKVEIKNMNSIRNVQKAIDHEMNRQISILEKGGTIVSETRMFDANSNETFGMRQKETLNDYRYFPEPDLQPILVNEVWLNQIKSEMPRLPGELFSKFVSQYQLPELDAQVLTETKEMAAYFELLCQETDLFKQVSNWLMGPVKSYLNEHKQEINQFPIQPNRLVELIKLVHEGRVSYSAAAQEIFPRMALDPNLSPVQLANRLNLIQNSDKEELQILVDQILSQMPEKVKEYKAGKKGLIGLFVGEVKKASNGKADPKLTNDLLLKALR